MACRYTLLGGCPRGRRAEGDRVLPGPVRLGHPARRARGRRLLHRSPGRPDRRGRQPQDGPARRPVGLDDLPGHRRRRRDRGQDQGGGRPGAGRADGRHGRGPDGGGHGPGRRRLRALAGREHHRHRRGQRAGHAGLERADEPGLRRQQGLLPGRIRVRLPGHERRRLQVRDAHGRRPRGGRHRRVPGGDTRAAARRLGRVLRRDRHRRRGGQGHRARRHASYSPSGTARTGGSGSSPTTTVPSSP